MLYTVSNVCGPDARFVHENDAVDYARRKSRADRGAFSWYVTVRQEAPSRTVAAFVRGESTAEE